MNSSATGVPEGSLHEREGMGLEAVSGITDIGFVLFAVLFSSEGMNREIVSQPLTPEHSRPNLSFRANLGCQPKEAAGWEYPSYGTPLR